MSALPKSFFQASSLDLAPALLGKVLIHKSVAGRTAGRIVETEAYLGELDPASHAFRGPSPRNRVMFEEGGVAYVYFTYGMHYCFNVVGGRAGDGEAVLVRAIEPTEGMELMAERRGHLPLVQLTNGPAKLVQAMGITKALYGHDLTKPPLLIEDAPDISDDKIIETTRIGIKQAADKPWRFYIKDNPFVSRA